MNPGRRDILQLGGGALIASAFSSRSLARLRDRAALDPLSYVLPELRDGARTVLKTSAELGPPSMQNLPKIRALGTGAIVAPVPDVPHYERSIPVAVHRRDVSIHVINAAAGAARPAILHTHGGGYVAGTARTDIAALQTMAKELGCAVVTVEYQLAPEATFATSTEENYAALRWLHHNAGALGVDTARIAVMGESAGGGHAALLAIMARDRGEVPLALQVLIYPMLDDRTGSFYRPPPFVGAIGWDNDANRFGWRAFLGAEPGGRRVPAAGVPARITNMKGLAPAFIAVGGVDLFLREDIGYARRLNEAGVPAELLVVPGAFHAFERVVPDAAVSRNFVRAKMNALRRAFGEQMQ